MAKQFNIPAASVEAATEYRNSAQSIRQILMALICLILAHPSNTLTAEELAGITGLSRSTVFAYLHFFRDLDKNNKAKELPSRGGRHNSYLTHDEEAIFLSSYDNYFIKGQILSANIIIDDFRGLVGHDVSASTVYRMFIRHDIRKVQPDTKHPNSDPIAQEEFKTNFPIYIGQALQKNYEEKPVLLMFQDEARFGRISDPRACWARRPYRPVVDLALVRQFQYIFGAIAPQNGRLDYMIGDKMDTENMNKFLRQVSRSHRNNFIIMVLDGAGCHKSKTLNIPKNMSLIFLPPYSPELNPIEPLWNIVRRNNMANRYFPTLGAVMEAATQGLAELQRDKPAMKRLTQWPYISPILKAI